MSEETVQFCLGAQMCNCMDKAGSPLNFTDLLYWTYLHSNGSWQVKRWYYSYETCDRCLAEFEKEQGNTNIEWVCPLIIWASNTFEVVTSAQRIRYPILILDTCNNSTDIYNPEPNRFMDIAEELDKE